MSRYNLQIKCGTYAGTGVAQDITGVGFSPDFVMVDANGTTNGVWKTTAMRGDSTSYFTNAVANFTGGVTTMLPDGFSIGADVTTNTNGSTYYYMAIHGTSGQRCFQVGKYFGDGADDRNYTGGAINFTPDVVFLKKDSTLAGEFKTASMTGDNTTPFANVLAADKIQSLISGGFQVGTSSNSSGVVFYFMAAKAVSGVIAYGTYTGDGKTTRKFTGIGFKPDAIVIHQNAAAQTRFKTVDMGATSTAQLGASASSTTYITSLDTDGFTTGSTGNTDTLAHYWVAFKQGNFNTPLIRTAA